MLNTLVSDIYVPSPCSLLSSTLFQAHFAPATLIYAPTIFHLLKLWAITTDKGACSCIVSVSHNRNSTVESPDSCDNYISVFLVIAV